MTAVEFIFQELENRENGYPHFTIQQIYNKAKELEKQQIIDSFNTGLFHGGKLISTGDEYYNETFNKNE